MLGPRPRTKPAAAVAHDPGHDDDAPARASGRPVTSPPAFRGRGSSRPPALPLARSPVSVARLLRGPHHFADGALRSPGAPVAVTNAAGTRTAVIITRVIMALGAFAIPGMALEALISFLFPTKAPVCGGPDAENLQSDQPHAPGRSRRFSVAVRGRRVSVRSLHGVWVVQLRGVSGSFAARRSSRRATIRRTFGKPLRRFFTDDQKRAIALESDQPGVSVSQVGRKHGSSRACCSAGACSSACAEEAREACARRAHRRRAGDASAAGLVQPPDEMRRSTCLTAGACSPLPASIHTPFVSALSVKEAKA